MHSEWTWLLGSNIGNQPTYLREQTPDTIGDAASDATGNTESRLQDYPGGRQGAAFWIDHAGIGWMFGGKGFDEHKSDFGRAVQDFWKFDILKKRWSAITLSSSSGKPGPRHKAAACGVHNLAVVLFGGENDFGRMKNDTWIFDVPNESWLPLFPSKVPVGRKDAAVWCNKTSLVLFGGQGESNAMFEDMWAFSLWHFTWDKLKPQGTTVPVGRSGAITWTTSSGILYMYGGQHVDKEEYGLKFSLLSDLWLFSAKNQSWNLIHLNTSSTKFAVYGIRGATSASNTPGARMHSASWIVDNNLWLYGGVGCASGDPKCQSHSTLADLWMFNTDTSQWTWQGGSQQTDAIPEYGDKGHSSKNNSPGSRSDCSSWSFQGVGFLFGGLGRDARQRTSFLNDLWLISKSDKTYVFTTRRSWLSGIHPGLVFLTVLASIGGIVLLFGAIFFLKKMLEYSRHRTYSGDFKVQYSPVSQEATLET